MIINNALRKRIEKFLPSNYRQAVVDRLKKRGITVHPNTVRNVLHGSNNKEVALEIIKLHNEEKELQEKLDAAIVAATE